MRHCSSRSLFIDCKILKAVKFSQFPTDSNDTFGAAAALLMLVFVRVSEYLCQYETATAYTFSHKFN